MDERVKRLKSPKECENFINNCRELGEEGLAAEGVERSLELRAEEHRAETQVERECLEAIYAFEEVKTAQKRLASPRKKVTRYRANRTWDMVTDHGLTGAAARAVDRRDATEGYRALKAAGLARFAFEAVILRHPDAFDARVVERARTRLSEA